MAPEKWHECSGGKILHCGGKVPTTPTNTDRSDFMAYPTESAQDVFYTYNVARKSFLWMGCKYFTEPERKVGLS